MPVAAVALWHYSTIVLLLFVAFWSMIIFNYGKGVGLSKERGLI